MARNLHGPRDTFKNTHEKAPGPVDLGRSQLPSLSARNHAKAHISIPATTKDQAHLYFAAAVVVHIVFWYDGVQSSDVLKVRPVAWVSRATADPSEGNLLPRSHQSLVSFASMA